jgi:hypothetical protein
MTLIRGDTEEARRHQIRDCASTITAFDAADIDTLESLLVARPLDVLARAMDDDLPTAEGLLALLPQPPATSSLEAPGRAVLEHIDRNRAIYRRALHPDLDSPLREVLIGRLETLLMGYLQAISDSVPTIGETKPTVAETRRLAVFTAAGTLGAIENWLAQDRPEPVDRMLTLLFTAAAPWWRQPARSGATRGLADNHSSRPRVGTVAADDAGPLPSS